MAKFRFPQFLQDHATKIATIILAILITIAAINNMIDKPRNLEPWILSIHYVLLSILLVLAELKVHFIIRNFGMLNFITGKGLFMLFLGAILFTSDFSFQLLVCILTLICGFVYIVGAINTLDAKQATTANNPNE